MKAQIAPLCAAAVTTSSEPPTNQPFVNGTNGGSPHTARPYIIGSYACCSVGFGLNSVWCILIGHTPAIMNTLQETGISVNPRVFYLAGVLAFALSCLLWPGATRHRENILRYLMPPAGLLGTLWFWAPAHSSTWPSIPWAPAGLFVTGIVFFWAQCRFVLLLARTRGTGAVIGCISAGLVVQLAVVEAATTSPSLGVQLACALGAFVMALALFESARACLRASSDSRAALLRCGKKTIYGVLQTRPCVVPASRAQRISTYVLVGIAATVLAVERCISYLGLWGHAQTSISAQHPWLLGVVAPAAAVALFAYAALYRAQRLPLATRFQPALFITMGGFFVAAIQSNPTGSSIALFSGIIQVCELYATLLLWTVTAVALDVLNLPSYRSIGLGWNIYAMLSIAWTTLLGSAPTLPGLVAMLSLYVLVAIIALFMAGNHTAQAHPSASSATDKKSTPSMPSLQESCIELASNAKLSPREIEVFMLLVRGRSHAFIQEELGISEGTVKTHIAHIYGKLNVRGRQELLDLAWQSEKPWLYPQGDLGNQPTPQSSDTPGL